MIGETDKQAHDMNQRDQELDYEANKKVGA